MKETNPPPQKQCFKCGIDLRYISGLQNGKYFICDNCRDITLLG